MEPNIVTREQYKQTQSTEQQVEQRLKFRLRFFPIWLRILVVTLLVVIAFVVGSMIGYGVIGDGEPIEVLEKSTWTYIVDLVNKEE